MREGKSDQTARCIKSRIMTKVIDYVLSINTFEQQCVVLKVSLQSSRLKDHVHTIGIYPSLRNNTIYEHKCIESIKKLYKQAVKCDNQKQFKYILDAAMVSAPEVFTVLDVNKKTAYRQVEAAKSKRKTFKFGNTPWALKQNQKGNSKMDE